ncbi:hypothetical protein QQ045_032359 [Rhodiola kirilowii]
MGGAGTAGGGEAKAVGFEGELEGRRDDRVLRGGKEVGRVVCSSANFGELGPMQGAQPAMLRLKLNQARVTGLTDSNIMTFHTQLTDHGGPAGANSVPSDVQSEACGTRHPLFPACPGDVGNREPKRFEHGLMQQAVGVRDADDGSKLLDPGTELEGDINMSIIMNTGIVETPKLPNTTAHPGNPKAIHVAGVCGELLEYVPKHP